MSNKKKEVKEVKIKPSKESFDFTVYSLIKQGLNQQQIADKFKVQKQNIAYYCKKLKARGLIEYIGYATWKVKKEYKQVKKQPRDTQLNLKSFLTSCKQDLKPDSVRGHAFIFTLKLPEIPKWCCESRKKFLVSKGVKFKPIGFNHSSQGIKFKGYKIWLNDKSINVYFNRWKSYFTDTAAESKNYAINDFKQLIIKLESFLGCNLKIDGNYLFKVSKNHYSLVQNSLAKQYNRDNKKLIVYEDGKGWFMIDNSYHLNEAETIDTERGVDDNKKVQDVFNSIRNTDIDFIKIEDKFANLDKLQDEMLERVIKNSKGQIYINQVIGQIESNTKDIIEIITKRS